MSNATGDTHRTRLLQAARTLLREREYGDISARDLVAASDTNLGSIGYHFGSKEALLNEAIGLALEEWADAVGNAIRGDVKGGLSALMASSMRTMLDEQESMRPYYLAFIEALARSARSPQLREQLAAHYRRQRDRVAGWILDALGEDALERDDARHLASLLLATADGMLIQSFVDPDDAPGSQELARATGKAFAAAPRATQ
ncbi:MAG TPA: TetR/AcrR family transcriptional regulator [Solirubrobacteraceae bacterium]|jgi:AcrR family transcriptional regulator|nr:TetR/AcrR family transcriptional regulator [Solirubrobacteraceae bacterium]